VKEWKRWEVTTGYLTAWHGLLLYSGAKTKRKVSTMWASLPYGDHDPIAMNTMTCDAFLQIRRTIHFCNNSELKPRGDTEYSPLEKVRKLSDLLTHGLRQCWNPGGKLTIDEQMIKYKGKAINFSSYMPKKPTRHGIKVYACTCAPKGYLLSHKVSVGGSNKKEKSVKVKIVSDLCKQSGMTRYVGVDL
jgi:hypothetical protein